MTAILSFFFFSPIGRYVGFALILAAVLGGTWLRGDQHGAARVQAKWDKAVAAAIERGQKARDDAESAVGDEPAGKLRNDHFNRD